MSRSVGKSLCDLERSRSCMMSDVGRFCCCFFEGMWILFGVFFLAKWSSLSILTAFCMFFYSTVDNFTPYSNVDKSTPYSTVDKSTPYSTVNKFTPYSTVDNSTPYFTVDNSTPLDKFTPSYTVGNFPVQFS